MAEQSQVRVEQGKVFLSNVPQEERQKKLSVRERLRFKTEALQRARRGLSQRREGSREHRRQVQIQRDLALTEKLREERRHESESRLAKETLASERKRSRRRFSFGRLRTRTTRRRNPSRRKRASKLPYHHGQHLNDIQCNIYRKYMREHKRYMRDMRMKMSR